ncbi:hypothetical protein AJ79_07989 [Helicocarpus griseus UAMH5409]|uniref:Uncharacterized protein n=1 Tax=Helicocarpus griseus UAMH5409 TaxID=1447875 RepID=A0A2B7WXR0_9EURO|nr:hypothetical protein AJ79_07989 [Helicocarpus griseus UAMH5409]
MPPIMPAPVPATHHCFHQTRPDPQHTCSHPDLDPYSDGLLPPILFQLDPPTERPTSTIRNLTENGQEVMGPDGEVVRDFPFLPRYIAVRPPAWQLEYWMRLDSRMSYRDIKARMTVGRNHLPSDNSLNMRREREARGPLGLSCWTSRRGGVTRTEIERVDRLEEDQVKLNTTMDVVGRTADNPGFLQARNLAGAPPACYPWDMFLVGQRLHVPSARLAEALALHEQLWDKVASSDVNDWRHLPADQLPSSWSRGGRGGRGDRSREPTEPNSNSQGPVTQQTPETGRQANQSLVGSNDHANDGNGSVGPPRLLSPFAVSDQTARRMPSLREIAPRSDQATWAGHDSFYWSGMGPGLTSQSHGIPTFSSQHSFPAPTHQFTPLNAGNYPPCYNPYLPAPQYFHPVAMTAPIPQNHMTIPQLQYHWSMSMTRMSSTNNYISDPTTPQRPAPLTQPASGHYLSAFDHTDTSVHTATSEQNFSTSVQQSQTQDELYRYNSSGQHSIRQNPDHRLNTDTNAIMQRNNPFDRIQQQDNPAAFSSFDDYMEDQM